MLSWTELKYLRAQLSQDVGNRKSPTGPTRHPQPAGVLKQEGCSVDGSRYVCSAALEIKNGILFLPPCWVSHTLWGARSRPSKLQAAHVFFIFFNLLLFNFHWEILQRHQSINSFNKCFIFIQRSCYSVSFVIIKTCINNMIIHNSDMFKLHLEFLPVCCILMWPWTGFCTFVVGNSDGNR